MPCYHPIPMWHSKDINKETGKRPLTANYGKAWRPLGRLPDTIYVPCGQCVGCRLEYSRQWAMRCVHEFESAGRVGSFLTLTYNSDSLPADGLVHKEEFQKFMKRLRKKFGSGLRFFACGEYGHQYKRPHYHAIIFGLHFSDLMIHTVRNGFQYYRSPTLEKLWPFGFSLIGSVTFESCAYVARYVMKKQMGKDVDDKKQPFVLMSRMPGLGQSWYKKYKNQIYPNDFIVVRDGVTCKPPPYYDSLLEKDDPVLYEQVKKARQEEYRRDDSLTSEEAQVLEIQERLKAKKLTKLVRQFHNDMDSYE